MKRRLASGVTRSFQDPYELRQDVQALSLCAAIGARVHALRKTQGVSGTKLAAMTGISVGMLSKVETGKTLPSLATVRALAQALCVPITTLLNLFEEPRSAFFVKANEALATRSGKAGIERRCRSLHQRAGSAPLALDANIVMLDSKLPLPTPLMQEGMKFVFMLGGEMRYRFGRQLYVLSPGDSLYFDASVAHGPERLLAGSALFLSILCARS